MSMPLGPPTDLIPAVERPNSIVLGGRGHEARIVSVIELSAIAERLKSFGYSAAPWYRSIIVGRLERADGQSVFMF